MTDMVIDYMVIFILVIVFFAVLYFVKTHLSRVSKLFVTEDRMVMDLKVEINELKKKITALELTIQVLLDKLATNNVPLPPSIVTNLPQSAKDSNAVKLLSRPVLLVYGEPSFGEQDRNAMRRAGVSFFRLVSSNLEDLRVELQRRRSDGRLYDVVHLSSHGGHGSVMLNSDVVTGTQLSDILGGVRCVFLATCENQEVSDKMIGVVKYVISVYEEITEEDAANFTYEFYKRYKENLDIESSFTGAILVMPHIGEFVDLRIGGK